MASPSSEAAFWQNYVAFAMRICRWNAHQEWLLVLPSDGALNVTLYVELDCQPSANTVYSTVSTYRFATKT